MGLWGGGLYRGGWLGRGGEVAEMAGFHGGEREREREVCYVESLFLGRWVCDGSYGGAEMAGMHGERERDAWVKTVRVFILCFS